MGMRKKLRTKWKADRKVQLANNRKKKAIRLSDDSKETKKAETPAA